MRTARDYILPAFFADSLVLGPHWIYDPGQISEWYPEGIRNYDAPRSSYHPGKQAGDLTHYGDQALALLECLAGSGDWPSEWRRWAVKARAEKISYFDGASRGTLENLEAGGAEPSESSDLGGAARAASVFLMPSSLEEVVELARIQTALTHGDPRVIDAAEFFARAAFSTGAGASFDESFDEAAGHPYEALPAIDWLSAARSSVDRELAVVASEFGISCDIDGAFQLTLATALCHESRPVEALSANAMLGGDSAARGMLLGLLFGARHGAGVFPAEWLDQLSAANRIEAALIR